MAGEDDIKRKLGKPMKMGTSLHTEDWKSGTEALALCMICGGEYPPDAGECPDCHVSLSVVRRCPFCGKIVSAQHKKCVYCRTSFTEELPKWNVPPDSPEPGHGDGVSPGVRRFRAAAVSISTFLVVFFLGMLFLRQINKPGFALQTIARARTIRSADLRRAPSATSSNIGKVSSGTSVNLTGFQENDQGRWMAVDWNNTVAYLPASVLSAPLAVEATDGADALKFYISGMDTTESVDEAVEAVDKYAQTFPHNAHAEELRWALAERLRALSSRGGSQAAALRREANQQYEKLTAANGKFAEKARDAQVKAPSGAEPEARQHSVKPKKDGLQIIGGSGTEISAAPTAAHDVLIVTQAEIRVRPVNLSQLSAGTVVGGHVINPVKANGMVAIPAGAACQLTVVSADPAMSRLGITLSSIDIEHRAYPVKAQVVDIRAGEGEAMDRPLNFRLEAPLVIEH